MSFKNQYLAELMETVIKRNPGEPEFHQEKYWNPLGLLSKDIRNI